MIAFEEKWQHEQWQPQLPSDVRSASLISQAFTKYYEKARTSCSQLK